MKFVLVGTRKGQSVVNWFGVVAASLLISAVSVVGSILMCFLLTGTFGFGGALEAVILLLFSVVGVSTHRTLQLPPEKLQSLD